MTVGTDIQSIYGALQGQCTGIADESLSAANAPRVAKSHQLLHDLELWSKVLDGRREAEILRSAAAEYQYSLLSLTLGLYRQAFKGLRLTLELCLQMVRLSAHELELREWLERRKDTVWDVLVSDEEGVFSARFARAFFPGLERHTKQHRALAAQVYRELSECVHGNVPKHVPLPASLKFAPASFDLWHEKAGVVALLMNLAFAMRYLTELKGPKPELFEAMLSERLGYIEEVRAVLGGPKGG